LEKLIELSAEGAKRIARQSLRQKDKVISIPSVGEMFVFLDRLRVLRSLSLFFAGFAKNAKPEREDTYGEFSDHTRRDQ
jgi:hypothetical protein